MGFVLGLYLGVAICVFLISMFFAALGGKEEDLYKPFIYAGCWPAFLLYNVFMLLR